MTAKLRGDWLTIAQVCADLQVTETDWHAWRQAGDTPLHIVTPSGQLRIRAADYARWLDSLTDDDASRSSIPLESRCTDEANAAAHGEHAPAALKRGAFMAAPGTAPAAAVLGLLRPLPAYRRQRIRDAIDAAGDCGLSRTEIWALTSRGYTLRQLNHALAELLASEAYEEIIVRTGIGRPPIRYRRKPSHTAGDDTSRQARAYASRSAVAERDGQR